MKSVHLRLLGNFPSRSVSSLQFYSDQIPSRKVLGEIQENMLEDSFSYLEEGTPRHIPTSCKKNPIERNKLLDLDKTIVQDTSNLVAVRIGSEKKQMGEDDRKSSKKIAITKALPKSASDLFGAIIKGDINFCISYLNKQ
eukprot:TRINITY_DN7876_c0_g2_i4.p1 TRINITY_DN7876_c0_g2~~TRINITY_DN7876_c0_g2_i4.p1  ORF type:complete len:140 (+),score=26.52 TRINITY_DN7876_c0_g2_i4:51-470(+)